MVEPEEYYNNYFTLFMQGGWKQFLEDVKGASEAIKILSIKDAKELHLAQGQLTVFTKLLNWEDSIKNTYDSIREEDTRTQEEELDA